MNLLERAEIAWDEHSITEVYESAHWYQLAREEFITEYIQNNSPYISQPCGCNVKHFIHGSYTYFECMNCNTVLVGGSDENS